MPKIIFYYKIITERWMLQNYLKCVIVIVNNKIISTSIIFNCRLQKCVIILLCDSGRAKLLHKAAAAAIAREHDHDLWCLPHFNSEKYFVLPAVTIFHHGARRRPLFLENQLRRWWRIEPSLPWKTGEPGGPFLYEKN